MRILAGLLVCLLRDACQVFLIYNDLQGYQRDAQRLAFRLGRLDRRQILLNQRADCLLIRLAAVLHRHIEIDERSQVLAERLGHPFRHEEVESGNRLSAVLLVLVGLENDSSQCRVALDTLRSTDAAVLCAESSFEEVVHVILDASCRLGRIIIQVMDMNVAQLVRFGKTFRQQIFVSIIFGHFRCESHHLPGRCVAAHVGVAQVDVVLVDSDNAVHHVLHLGFLVPLRIPPFAIDDILLRYFRPHLHQCLFH